MPRAKLTDEEKALRAYQRRAERNGIVIEKRPNSETDQHFMKRVAHELEKQRKGDRTRRDARRMTVPR